MSTYISDPNSFKFKKPTNWTYMPLYEKIRYYCRVLTADYAPYVDKIYAKEIVKGICGDRIEVAKLIRILSDPNDISECDLSSNYIIKSAHGSGWNISTFKDVTIDSIIKCLEKWNRTYSISEIQYTFLKPRFYIEEKVNDIWSGISGNAQVFMFRCIHGSPITIGVKRDSIQNSYDINWIPLSRDSFKLERPPQIDEMIELAKMLSAPFEFVRIDFYLSKDGRIYFSEFTFTPAGGNIVFSKHHELVLGRLWK